MYRRELPACPAAHADTSAGQLQIQSEALEPEEYVVVFGGFAAKNNDIFPSARHNRATC
jgi:hypothetical protein